MAKDKGSLFGGPTRAEFRVGIVLGVALLLAAWQAAYEGDVDGGTPVVPAATSGLEFAGGAADETAPSDDDPADRSTELAPTPRLHRVVVPVPDLDRAAAWYGELLDVAGERVSRGRHELDCGGTTLALVQSSGEHAARALPDHLDFAVSDLEAVSARARTLGDPSDGTGDCARSAGEVTERSEGERSFSTRDPWGRRLCFVDEETVSTGR